MQAGLKAQGSGQPREEAIPGRSARSRWAITFGKELESLYPLVSSYPFEILQQLLWVGFPEEIVFRGYLLTRLRESWGTTVALFISAFLFGIAHLGLGDIAHAILAGLAGLIFGWVFIKTESVYASTLAHIGENLFSGAIIRFFLFS